MVLHITIYTFCNVNLFWVFPIVPDLLVADESSAQILTLPALSCPARNINLQSDISV